MYNAPSRRYRMATTAASLAPGRNVPHSSNDRSREERRLEKGLEGGPSSSRIAHSVWKVGVDDRRDELSDRGAGGGDPARERPPVRVLPDAQCHRSGAVAARGAEPGRDQGDPG